MANDKDGGSAQRTRVFTWRLWLTFALAWLVTGFWPAGEAPRNDGGAGGLARVWGSYLEVYQNADGAAFSAVVLHVAICLLFAYVVRCLSLAIISRKPRDGAS